MEEVHFHSKKEVEGYEENWQRLFYRKSGDYLVHVCEVCGGSEDVGRIPGGHYICYECAKKLRLPKEQTVVKWGKEIVTKSKRAQKKLQSRIPSEIARKTRVKNWKKIIKSDYIIALYEKNFRKRKPEPKYSI